MPDESKRTKRKTLNFRDMIKNLTPLGKNLFKAILWVVFLYLLISTRDIIIY